MIARSDVAKIERIEVATIEPGDILFIHLDEPITAKEVDPLKDRFGEVTGLANRVVFLTGMEIEIKRPADQDLPTSA